MKSKEVKVILGVDAISPPLTGIGRYTYELARGLHQSGEVEARFFALARWIADPAALIDPQRPSAVLRRNMAHIPFSGLLRQAYQRTSRWIFAQEVRKLRGYLYHSPNFYMVPFEGPTIATIHDLSVIHHPEFHPEERVAFMQRELPLALQRSDHLITVSEYVRKDIIETYRIAPERISVTPLGVDPAYHPRSDETLATTLAGYGLIPRGYILCVATLEPRKNIARLVEAFCTLPQALQLRFPLVLVGDRGWKSDDLHHVLESLQTQGRARYLGFVPEQHLPLMYSGARLFAYPSLSEGFGLPVLEAMASGVPVITSNCTSLPEVAGYAAILIDPTDVALLRDSMQAFLENDELCETYVQKGLAQAQGFTWPAFVEKTIDIYREVALRHAVTSG